MFCEGKNSEPDYVNGLKRLPHVVGDTSLDLRLFPEQGVPLTLVRMAVDRLRDPEIDECWCLFDVEWPRNHPHLATAIDLAGSNGVRLAVSNPCFEIWLILHHRDVTAFGLTADVERASRSLDRRAGKSIDATVYMPLRKEAATRAECLRDRHLRDGTVFPNDNPSSGMFEFLRALEPDQRTLVVGCG